MTCFVCHDHYFHRLSLGWEILERDSVVKNRDHLGLYFPKAAFNEGHRKPVLAGGCILVEQVDCCLIFPGLTLLELLIR
jgi:hypothetical protein